MLATPSEFEDLWNAAIKQDLVDSEDKKLFVFVSSAEADSVCALHILQVWCNPFSLGRWPVHHRATDSMLRACLS